MDGKPLKGIYLRTIRSQTAWVDPAIQLWNQSLLDNLIYGAEENKAASHGFSIEEADLFDVLERLDHGLKTELGESGGLVSGGEGQRVRLARAMNRTNPRLVILDEPFRGLDREKRRLLLVRALKHWESATLICVTHDVSETLHFSRVLVVENGQILEDGNPNELAANEKSRFGQLIQAEEAVHKNLWQNANWRRLWMEGGNLAEIRE